MEKANVIFIGSDSRSGSTLLDLMIGQLDDFISIGEIRYIWTRAFEENQLCGCKLKFHECRFWNNVFEEAFGSKNNIDGHHIKELQMFVDRPYKFLPFSKIKNLKNIGTYNQKKQEYTDVMTKIYIAIHKVSNKKYIIDSSKAPSHGFLLQGAEKINFLPIQLVRDSRAVVYSLQRKKIRPEIHWKTEYMPTMGTFKSSLRWSIIYSLLSYMRSKSPKSAIVRYEDMVNNPENTLRKILEELELIEDVSFNSKINGNSIELSENHTVSGNPMRFKRGNIELITDNEWEKSMSIKKKTVTTAITLPYLINYDYLINDRES